MQMPLRKPIKHKRKQMQDKITTTTWKQSTNFLFYQVVIENSDCIIQSWCFMLL